MSTVTTLNVNDEIIIVDIVEPDYWSATGPGKHERDHIIGQRVLVIGNLYRPPRLDKEKNSWDVLVKFDPGFINKHKDTTFGAEQIRNGCVDFTALVCSLSIHPKSKNIKDEDAILNSRPTCCGVRTVWRELYLRCPVCFKFHG
jgi:hypothetical protein